MRRFAHPPPPLRTKKHSTSVQLKRGTIHAYFEDEKLGTIKGKIGKKYPFHRSDFISDIEPKLGMKVVFEVEGFRAVKIRRHDGVTFG